MRLLRHPLNWSSLVTVMAATAIVSCGDGPTGNQGPGPATAVKLIGPEGQRAFAGEALPLPLSFKVVDAKGRTVPGVHRIRYAITDVTGAVSDSVADTNADGFGAIYWRLGTTIGVQRLTATLADVPDATGAIASAHSVSPDQADVVVLRGAAEGPIGVLITVASTTTVLRLTWPDTVLRLLPRGPVPPSPFGVIAWEDVTAFNVGRAPAAAVRPWTDDADTIQLVLRPPVAVPVKVWIVSDYDATLARAQYEIGNVDTYWRSVPSGLAVGDVDVEYVPDLEGQVFSCTDIVGRTASGALNLFYTTNFFAASVCNGNSVVMGPNPNYLQPGYAMRLPWAVGYTLGLGTSSTPGNLMYGYYPWTPPLLLTTGQVYRMHFASYSLLNSVLGVRPAGERNCFAAISPCPAETFDIVW
jgi:hypothetical protein